MKDLSAYIAETVPVKVFTLTVEAIVGQGVSYFPDGYSEALAFCVWRSRSTSITLSSEIPFAASNTVK